MSKILSFIASSSLLVVLSTSAALADSITNTGDGSTNVINNTQVSENGYICVNDVNIDTNNDQEGETGDSENSGNTTGGDANSGDANNENNTNVDVDIECPEGTHPEKVVTPPTGGQGGGAVVTPVAAPTKLPETGANDTAQKALLAVGGLTALTAAGQAGLSLYRRKV